MRPASIAAILVTALSLSACGSGKSSARSDLPVPPTSPAPSASSATPGSTGPSGVPDLADVHVALRAVVKGLDSPVAVAWRTGDSHMFVAEQTGRVRLVDNTGHIAATPVLTVGPLSNGNEEGLLDITFSRDGTKLYVDYTDPRDDTHVDEYMMRGESAVASSRRQLLVVAQPFANHKGGEVVTGPDGMLYIGLGDGGSEGDPNHNGQDLGTLLSKILRIDPAPSASAPYSVPADNPFVAKRGARPETWMWGLRNPWRFSFDRATGALWIGDVGQDKYEEVDYAPKGQAGINWGWSEREGLHSFRGAMPAGARDPIVETSHADGNCAIVGGYVYRGAKIPALTGAYLFGDDCRPRIVGVVRAGNGTAVTRDLGPEVAQLATFAEDPAGEVYAVTRTGTVYEVVPG